MKLFDPKRTRHLIALLLAGAFMVPSYVWGLNTVTSGFKTTTADIGIDAHGVCKMVRHSSGAAVFVPTKTAGEWQAFRNNAPANVAIGNCQICEYTAGSFFVSHTTTNTTSHTFRHTGQTLGTVNSTTLNFDNNSSPTLFSRGAFQETVSGVSYYEICHNATGSWPQVGSNNPCSSGYNAPYQSCNSNHFAIPCGTIGAYCKFVPAACVENIHQCLE